ncbi:MAG: MFS transporter [Desulfobacter sp.]|nr:MAG: MFS transporter [Desulfobacter sp.]
MQETKCHVYGYRWVILLVFSLITAIIQIQWLAFASVAREARIFYNASALEIDILSLIFMVVFLVVCIPASWAIDRFGVKAGLSIGAVLTGVFGLMKGLFPENYAMVVTAQTGLAVAQPFILNAATKVAVNWFPIDERAIAVGVATLAQFAGIIIVMVLTPFMIVTSTPEQYDIGGMLMTYGLVSVAGAAIFLVFFREKPLTPPEQIESHKEFSVGQSIRHIIKQPDMPYIFSLFFIGLGVFNAVSTCIDQICQAKGLTMEQTGIIGGIMLVAGIIGAVILPLLSDKFKRRKLFICLAMAGTVPGIAGLVFFTDYGWLLAAASTMGFFLLGAGAPVGFQYCAEITRPAPEPISQGLLLFTGQVSGILFILFMNFTGVWPAMLSFLGLTLVNMVLALFIKESPVILKVRQS